MSEGAGKREKKNARKRKYAGAGKDGNKVNWTKRKQNSDVANLKDSSGFLISCDQGKERLAIKQSLTVLLEIIEGLEEDLEEKDETQPIKGDAKNNAELDISESIANEISKHKSEAAKLIAVETGGKGLIFLKLDNSCKIDTVKVCKTLIKNLQKSKEANTTCCSRFIPLQYICASKKSDVLEHVKRFLTDYFRSLKKTECTYAIQFKKRFCDSFKRDEIINDVGNLLDETSEEAKKSIKADLNKPNLTIMIEAFKSIVGISLVEDIADLGKFNVRTATA